MPDLDMPVAPPQRRSVTMVDPATGRAADVPLEQVAAYQDQGFTLESTDERSHRLAAEAQESIYGGAKGAFLAGAAGVLRGATLGGSDVAARALEGDDAAIALQGYREHHPGVSFGTELAGAVLPSVFSGGAAAPAGAASALGRGAAQAVGGGIRGAIAGGVVEGGLFGVGQGVSELALSRDPLTLEHAAAAVGSNALYGAAAGGVAGGAIKGVEVGLGSAKRALDRALLARSEGRAMQAKADAMAHPPGIGTEVEIEYPADIPRNNAGAAASGPVVVRKVGRKEMEATLPDGSTRRLDMSERAQDDFLASQMPDGFKPGSVAISPSRDFSVQRGVPANPGAITENALYVVKPSELVERKLIGDALETADRTAQKYTDDIENLFKEGQKFDPLTAYVKPDGTIYIEDGNHRLQWAARTDREVAVHFKDAARYEPKPNARDITERVRGELPLSPAPTAVPATEGAPMPSVTRVPLSSLDKKGLDLAEKVETERALAARQPARERFVELLDEAHKAREPNKEWLEIVADRNPDKYTREQAKVVFNVDRRVRNLLDNREGLAARPSRATEWLQQERQALDGLMERGKIDLETYRETASAAPETVRKELLAGDIKGFIVGKGGISPTSPVIDDIIAREVQARFPRDPRGALIVPKELAGFEDNRLGIALARNTELRQMIANLERAPRSDRLAQIEAAREALGARTAPPKPEPAISLGREVLKVAAHAVPFGGLVEKATGALGGLRKAVGAGAERVGRAASTFLGKAAPVAGRAAAIAPPVATKVLAALRYGEPETDERGRHVAKPEPKSLPELYRARTDEIKSQVQLAPDGTYQMKPAARVKMAARLSGLGVVDPIAADRLESAGAARIAWLASQMPRRPDMAGLPVGPDTWQPSDAAMRSWTRKAAAAEDPYGVLERASAGKNARVVPEEIMAMRALQPALLNDYVTQIIMGLPERKTRLPYPQRLALSMLTGRPLDPAMTPAVLREFQSMFAMEPGTAGGTMAPRSNPQFGSVKRSEQGTPAQRRQGVGL